MKKNLFFALMLISILMLVACNTTDVPPTDSTNGTDTTNEGKGEITESDDKQNDSSKNGNVTEEEPKATPNETNGDTTEVSGDLYTMQISNGFTFTPEEPGKDIVLYDENDKVSMRIEAFTKNDIAYEDLVTNTKDWMTAVNEQYDTNNIDTLLTDQNITNATSFIANVEDEKVVTVVFEKGNLIVRLTVFDLNDVNLTDKLIKMGLTIQEK